MSTRIPLPGNMIDTLMKGVDTGGAMYTRAMNPILEREKQAQLERHFQEQLKLSKAAAGRNAELFKYRLQEMQDKHAAAQFKRNMMNQLMGGESSGGDMGGAMPQEMPTETMGQGQGVFTPEGLAQAQKALSAPKTAPTGNNALMNKLMQNPAMRGWFKHEFGYDPLAQSGGAYHGAARDAYDLERLRKEVGEDSPVYQNALSSYNSTLDARKDLRDLRERTKQGLKPGEKEFFDEETGEPLGKEIPLTAKERESEEGNSLFNSLYPLVYKGASPFSGEGSIKRLENAAANYKTNPEARKLFDDFLLAEKALAATVVNEASTLNAGRTNRTYSMLKESLESQDIPSVLKRIIKQYQIPASANLKAGMRYQKALSDARGKAKRDVPATRRMFYNPEMQAQHQAEKEEGGSSETGTVIVIDPNGKRFKTPAANAAHLPEGWSRD